jgi:hypothetical protein
LTTCSLHLPHPSTSSNHLLDNGRTVLMYACEKGLPAVVEQLVVRSARVNLVDASGKSAKSYASLMKQERCLDKLPKSAKLGSVLGVTDESSATFFGAGELGASAAQVAHLQRQLEETTVRLEQQTRGWALAKESITQLSDQLQVFVNDGAAGDDDISFSDDDGDLLDDGDGGGGGSASSGAGGTDAGGAAVKVLKARVAALQMENAKLRDIGASTGGDGGGGGGGGGGRGGGGGDKAARDELTQCKQQVVLLEEKLSDLTGNIPHVPVVVLDLLKNDFKAQIETLKAEVAAASEPAMDSDTAAMVGTLKEQHTRELAGYRRQLLLAFQNKLSGPLADALSKVVHAGSATADQPAAAAPGITTTTAGGAANPPPEVTGM